MTQTTTAVHEPTDAQIIKAARALINLELSGLSFWRSNFCEDCDSCEMWGGVEECDAEFDPTDGACANHDLIYENEEVIERAREMFAPDEDEEEYEEIEGAA